MFRRIIKYIKCLIFGCEEKSEHQKWLEKKVADKEKELEVIENEDNSIDDNIDYLNK
jgi:hypothetical protein